MSFKTIAVDVKTYENLSRAKRPSESFTKTIDRLLKDARSTYTCGNAYETVSRIVKKPLSSQEAEEMENIVEDNRRNTRWNTPYSPNRTTTCGSPPPPGPPGAAC